MGGHLCLEAAGFLWGWRKALWEAPEPGEDTMRGVPPGMTPGFRRAAGITGTKG